ncbi:MAG: hypothetical protein GX310_09660, partial [Synergistaceae bacterium]|nr:hypothetical protein [Synergistaceae bacterium]
TPPVGLAVYAASCIAGADFWKTSKQSLLLALPAFVVPFLFVFHPTLVGLGDVTSVISAGGSGLLGAVILGSGLSGWFFQQVSLPERGILIVSGILLILPGWPSNIAGIALALAVWAFRKLRTGGGRPGNAAGF